MNKKFELNEIELDQIAGGRPRVRPNPALSNAVHIIDTYSLNAIS